MTDLRRLAEQATPGPWHWDGRVHEYTPRQRNPFADFGAGIEAGEQTVIEGGAQDEQGGAVGILRAADAAFIAAANPHAILALLDERDEYMAKLGEQIGVPSAAERRVASLEEVVRRFLSLEVRDTRRGSLPLRADSFSGIAQEARALLTSASTEAEDDG